MAVWLGPQAVGNVADATGLGSTPEPEPFASRCAPVKPGGGGGVSFLEEIHPLVKPMLLVRCMILHVASLMVLFLKRAGL